MQTHIHSLTFTIYAHEKNQIISFSTHFIFIRDLPINYSFIYISVTNFFCDRTKAKKKENSFNHWISIELFDDHCMIKFCLVDYSWKSRAKTKSCKSKYIHHYNQSLVKSSAIN